MSDIDSRVPVDGAGNGVMRPVRHPMTMFILAVLVVIGIGVGVVAVTTSERVYGPSWGRFSAVFPGGVSEHRVGPSVWAYGYAPSSGYLSFGAGWTAYARLSLPTTVFSVTALDSPVRSNYALSVDASLVRTGWFHKGVAEDERHANGLHITTLGPQCVRRSCIAVELVSNGGVLWTLTAISPRSEDAVKDFLDSFQPIA
jgi:hypothetical protein